MVSEMDIITEKEYRRIIKQYNQLVDLILAKTEQLALIERGRRPRGTCDEIDFEEKDGKLLVEFERYYCGESGYESYYLPLEFLFDENYPEKYKVIFEEEKRKKEQEKKRKQEEKIKKEVELMEAFERSEYERLKKKFEGDIHGKRE